jgi:hypothetical protein
VGVAVAIREAIEPFSSDVLAKMVVICALLRAVSGGHNRGGDALPRPGEME